MSVGSLTIFWHQPAVYVLCRTSNDSGAYPTRLHILVLTTRKVGRMFLRCDRAAGSVQQVE